MPFVRVARVEQVPPGRTAWFRVASTPLLIANAGGRLFALHGLCPHRNNPLDGAMLVGYLVDCPWHHFQYDVRTGANHYPSNVYPSDMPELQEQLRPVRTYSIEVRDGDILVDLP